eukprot:scaffold4.g4934.t1
MELCCGTSGISPCRAVWRRTAAPHYCSRRRARAVVAAAEADELLAAGPSTPRPDYAALDAQPLNRAVYALFRRKMVAAVGADCSLQGYDAIIDLTRRLNAMHATPRGTQLATRAILKSLFPSWLPGAFAVMFARPLPGLSCQLNAWATWLTCQWLMGECEVNDVEIDGGGIGAAHGVLVKRCRYLEECGCASICINSCKVPTEVGPPAGGVPTRYMRRAPAPPHREASPSQEFFARDMGLQLEMKPNYEDFSCQFSFGKTPPPQESDPAFATLCFRQCPTAARGGGGRRGAGAAGSAALCPKIDLES